MPNYLKYILVGCAGCLLFLPFLGHVHLFDWDEINFAECAREMIVSKDYLRTQVDFMPFWEKPPFFIWMQVLAMKLFGVSEFAARLPNALIGVTTLITLFYAGKKAATEKLAAWWVAIYATTWLPHLYFKSGIIDPTFNFFIFIAVFEVHLLRRSLRPWMHVVAAGLFLGLAVLTKGPVALLVASLTLLVYMVINRGTGGYKLQHLLMVGIIALLPVAIWLGVAVINYGSAYGTWFLNEFIQYQVRLFSTEDADHGGPFYYHFVVLLLGCFPASLLLFGIVGKKSDPAAPTREFTRWMWILFWVVLILFSVVKTKIVHYSSLCYFPLTYLAALQMSRIDQYRELPRRWLRWAVLIIGSLLALVITSLPLAGIFKEKLVPLIQDVFVVANLRAAVSWSFAECTWGLLYFTGVVISVILMKHNFARGMSLLCGVQLLIIQVALVHFTPKVEAYTQGAAIDYYRTFRGSDVYVHPLGFKSYAVLFYTAKSPSLNPMYKSTRIDNKGRDLQPEANENWLIAGKIDKPAYFICKVQDSARFSRFPQLTLTGSSNGFVFFSRQPAP